MSQGVSQPDYTPVLELREAVPIFDEEGLSPLKYTLAVEPGDCVFIESRDDLQTAQFTNLCAGILPIGSGKVRCMGLEWQALDERRAHALRGRIGRISEDSGWIDLYGMHLNILWPRLHHSRSSYAKFVEEAVALALRFGLPGLPTQLPERLSALDRKRAEYVRAFMGRPSLLLLENPLSLAAPKELYNAFLSELTAARERGCAVVWIGAERSAWSGYAQPNMQKFRLGDNGLIEVRGV